MALKTSQQSTARYHAAMASPSLRRSKDGNARGALERRINELEHIADRQSRELRIQFERIAQLQAEVDIFRIRFITT